MIPILDVFLIGLNCLLGIIIIYSVYDVWKELKKGAKANVDN